MSINGYGLLALAAFAAIYVITVYNSLVQLRTGVSKAWANIDVLILQRHDELPNLVEVCKGYMAYERETITNVVTARAAVSSARETANLSGFGPAEEQLRLGLDHLFAVAENYPGLKANDMFRNLQARITGLENAIADRREFYNDAVTRLNTRMEQFPDRIIASLCAVKPGQWLGKTGVRVIFR
ncbi:LemA family protein [Rhodanobacter sp. Root179]|uniref:LemA family protein n=1 Tax=Rhodanobacter sp. Root179 TaxID=1736482 RepID=UPI0006F63E14|nr:LemA family protein [Rhodanobacter sp. Root179]KRB53782.1 LemA family protein [Rhodanobacter sp. Root179]